VAAGVSFLTDGDETGSGFAVDFSKGLISSGQLNVGAVGDVGWHHFEGFNALSVMGGVRIGVAGDRRYAPFGQFLIGGARFSTSFCEGDGCSESDLVFAPGGGIDIRLTGKLSFRAQIDLLFIKFADGTEDATRLTFGVAVPVGR
jgi:hypothetical protein